MLQKKSYLVPINKINIWWVNLIHIYCNFNKKICNFNFYIKVTVKATKLETIIKKKSKLIGLINLTKKEIIFYDNSYIKFKINSILLLKKKNLPLGKELLNPTLFFLKRKKLLIFFYYYI